MDWLHKTMSEAMLSRWTSQVTRSALDTWAKGLHDMTITQIRRGVWNAMNTPDWWPTLPSFREMCLTAPGLPSSDDAWAEAEDIAAKRKPASECSHPAIWHAYVQCGDLGHTDTTVGEKRFRQKYAVASRDFAAGKPMSEIPEALPAPGQQARKELTPEEIAERDRKREEAVAAINRMFGRGA